MNIRIENIARGIIAYRIYILILIIIITAASLSQLIKIKVYNGLDIWIEKSSAEYSDYIRFIKEFGNDESIILLYHSDSLSTNSHLKLNYQITDSLEAIDGVKDVISLATVKIPSKSVAGPAMINLLPKSMSNPARLQERLLHYRTYKDFLISNDFKTTSFIIIPDSTTERSELLDRVNRFAAKLQNSERDYVIFGSIPLKESLRILSGAESKKFLLITFALLLIYIYLLLKRLIESLLPLIIALITICWTLGLMAAAGVSFNVVMSSLPLILLVISIANSIHFISGQIMAHEEYNNKTESIVYNFVNKYKKCLFSSLTTAIALFSFTFSDIIPLRNYGLFSSFGVLLSFFLTFSILPVIYSYSKINERITVFGSKPVFKNINYANSLNANKKTIYFVSVLIFIVSIIGITKLRVNTDQVTYFKKNHQIRIANDKASKWFSGVVPLELVFDLDTSIYMLPESYFSRLYDFEERLPEIPQIKSWQSVVTILDDYGMVKNKRLSISGFTGQNSRNSAGLLSHFVSGDGKSIRTTIRTSWINDKEEIDLMRRIGVILEESLHGSGIKFHFTGIVPVFAHLSNRLVESQIKSSLFTFIAIICMFLILYRNVRVVIVCLIPNIIPVVTTLGLMGFLKIPLDVATVLIASVSFGIAVDDTIHFVSTYQEYMLGNNIYKSIDKTLSSIGKALIATSLLLIGGFIIMIFSSYRPLAFMGVFISVNVFLALICDLVVLPSILLYGKK